MTSPIDPTVLAALISRWSDQDKLAYSRWSAFWTTQSVLVGAAALTYVAGGSGVRPHVGSLVAGGLLCIASACGLSFIVIFRMDRLVRNTFNTQIVDGLIERGVLHQRSFESSTVWRPDLEWHPRNLWHVADPQGCGRGTLGRGIVLWQLGSFVVIEGIIGLLLIMATFAQMLLAHLALRFVHC